MKQKEVHIGKVLKATRKTYNVAVDGRILSCTVRGKLIQDTSEYGSVKVGDNVEVTLVSDREGVIEKILPRKSQLSRVIESRAYQEHIVAANIDRVLIILSTRNPAFKSGLLDRYLVITEKNNLQAFICINKIDLADPGEFYPYRDYYSSIGYPVYFTSALTGEGIEELSRILKDGVTALVGHSGVGKSSIIKAIEPELDIKIARISERTHKGQHTTTAVELFPLSNGGFVIDTPGIRELGFWGIYKKDLADYFIEFKQLAPECQFADCTHLHEPGCAVKQAVEEGRIFRERYRNYLNIYQSLKNASYE